MCGNAADAAGPALAEQRVYTAFIPKPAKARDAVLYPIRPFDRAEREEKSGARARQIFPSAAPPPGGFGRNDDGRPGREKVCHRMLGDVLNGKAREEDEG